jgi:thiol:disulfide interchange protein DsbA
LIVRKLLFALALTFWGCTSGAQDFMAGTHYVELPQVVPTRSGDKIEVLEFFAYSCGHCYNFEPVIKQWEKTLPDDVAFAASPVVWSQPMEPHAKAFYVAQALGVLDRMHGVIFAAMHVDRNRLSDDASIRKLFVSNGVAAADFDKAWRSFGVGAQVRQAASRAVSAGIEGTPEMLVAGKYRVSARFQGVRSSADMLKVVDYLLERERMAAGAASAN